MAQYKLYRHPTRGVVAVREGSWLSALSGQEERLVRGGYHYTGMTEANSPHEAVSRAQPGGGPRPSMTSHATAIATANAETTRQALTVGAVLMSLSLMVMGLLLARNFFGEREQPAAMDDGGPARVLAVDEYSAWLSFDETRDYAQQIDMRYYRVTGVEGRAEGGGQCRVRVGAAPPTKHRWFWWCAQPEDVFEQRDREYREQGFTRVQHQSYSDADGRTWHSAAWHRESSADE